MPESPKPDPAPPQLQDADWRKLGEAERERDKLRRERARGRPRNPARRIAGHARRRPAV